MRLAAPTGTIDGMHVVLAQTAGCAAVAGVAWAMVRAGVAKGALRVKAPARCAACGRQKVWGSCSCTGGPNRPS
jgi:hypothetical protein